MLNWLRNKRCEMEKTESFKQAYQTRWVWYHTILALELFFSNMMQFVQVGLLIYIAYLLTEIIEKGASG